MILVVKERGKCTTRDVASHEKDVACVLRETAIETETEAKVETESEMETEMETQMEIQMETQTETEQI